MRAIAVPAESHTIVAASPSAQTSNVAVVLTDENELRPRPRQAKLLDRALFEAAGQGDLEDITALLTAGANANAAIPGDGNPLIGAAKNGHLAAVRLLLNRGADPNMTVSGDGNALIVAAKEGHVDVIELLLNRGADVDQVVPGDESALIQASGNGQLAAAKLLVARGANVNTRVWVESAFGKPNGEWRSPLSMARKGRHDAMVQYLLSLGAAE